MSDDRPIHLTSQGPPQTVLPAPDPEAARALAYALATDGDRRAAVASVVARWPRFVDAWAALGDLGRDDIDRYAAYRVGYHRGLDMLRRNGWKGAGPIPWTHEPNRGFLRSLSALGQAAALFEEKDEVARVQAFLLDADPQIPAELLP